MEQGYFSSAPAGPAPDKQPRSPAGHAGMRGSARPSRPVDRACRQCRTAVFSWLSILRASSLHPARMPGPQKKIFICHWTSTQKDLLRGRKRKRRR